MRVQTKYLLLSFLLAATLIPDVAFGSKCDCCPCPCTCECEETVLPTVTPRPTIPTEPPITVCREVCLDLGLIVDGSSSINEANWVIVKNFMNAVANSFDIGVLNTMTAVIQFSQTAWEEMGFPDPANAASGTLAAKYASIEQRHGPTALTHGIELYLNHTRLYRRMVVPPNSNCSNINEAVVIITDGLPNIGVATLSDAQEALQDALGENIFGVAIGVPNITSLIETVGAADRVFPSDDFEALFLILDELIAKICQTIQPQTTQPPAVEVPPPLPINKCKCCCPPPVPVQFNVGAWTPKCEVTSDSSSSTQTSTMTMSSA